MYHRGGLEFEVQKLSWDYGRNFTQVTGYGFILRSELCFLGTVHIFLLYVLFLGSIE